MALQTGVGTSKVLVLVGAGLTGSIILRNGKLSEVMGQLQELLKGVNDVEISPYKYDPAMLSAQIRQLAEEIKELSLSRPVTIFNGNPSESWASYLVPAAALGAMGYCYMWWKGLSFSDVMFVTKQNMKNAVMTVSKQLDQLSDTLSSTRKHLSKRLESLDWKIEEQIDTSKSIANNVEEMQSHLTTIGYDVEMINKMIADLEGKLERIEGSQDTTTSGLLYLCQFTEGFEDGLRRKVFQEIGSKVTIPPALTFEEKFPKGLQFLAEDKELEAVEKSVDVVRSSKAVNVSGEKTKTVLTRVHRSYPVGFSLARDPSGI